MATRRDAQQAVEKVRQRRSRKTQPPHHLGGVHKRAALYSARREPQRLNVPTGKELREQLGRAGENGYASPIRHWALTVSRPSASMTLLIRRVADLAAALPDGPF